MAGNLCRVRWATIRRFKSSPHGGVMALATQFLIQAPHKPGTLAQVCSELAKVAVNITAIMASHDEAGGLRIVATPLPAAKKVLDGLGLRYQEEEVLAVRVSDRPGALGKITRKLADADQHRIRLRIDREGRIEGADHS